MAVLAGGGRIFGWQFWRRWEDIWMAVLAEGGDIWVAVLGWELRIFGW